MEMRLRLVHEHKRALIHAFNELGDGEKDDLMTRTQPSEQPAYRSPDVVQIESKQGGDISLFEYWI
jgi:hypothetical protein